MTEPEAGQDAGLGYSQEEGPALRREPSAQDTAHMPPVVAADASWWVVLVAALVSFAFLVGVMLGASRQPATAGRQPAVEATAESASQQETRQAAQSAGAIAPRAEPDGYYMGASTSPERPAQSPLAVPATATKVYYHYSLPGWPADAQIDFSWTVKGKPLPSDGVSWIPHQNVPWAQGYFELSPPGGAATFAPGIYEVELSGPDDLREVGSFAVLQGLEAMMAQEAPPGGLLVGRPVIAVEVDGQGRPVKSADQIPPSVSKLYACFTYDGALPDTKLIVRWFYGEVEVEAARSELRLPAAAGQAYAILQVAKGPLPLGTWKVAVYLGGVEKPRAEASFVVTEKAAIPEGGGASGASKQPARSPASGKPAPGPSQRPPAR
ncbi:MAG: hypothetical protein N2512_02370 [Armatimonadetes bacterium]|nr:hypothetical protein [Armatimonadota bacterium]